MRSFKTFLVVVSLLTLSTSAALAVTAYQEVTISVVSVPLPPITPPSGMHWVLTFDDEFTQDTAVNYADWATLGNVALAGANGIAIITDTTQPTQRTSLCRIAHNSGNFCYSNPPMPIYGYYEANYQIPATAGGQADGFHVDYWFRSASNVGEDDIDEYYPSESASTATFATNYIHFESDVTNTYPSTSVGGLDTSFHTYAMYWANDGTAYGSLSIFFDGQQVTTPYPLDNEWTDGAYAKFTIDPCGPSCSGSASNDNPWYIRYYREWQLAPN